MIRAETITFLKEDPHGVFEANTPTEVERFAEIRSVRSSEFYQAENAGITPQHTFVMTDYSDYPEWAKLIRFNGSLYDIVRTYVKGQTIEIVVKNHEVNQ